MPLTAQQFQKTSHNLGNDFASLLYSQSPISPGHRVDSVPVKELAEWRDEWVRAKQRANHSPRTAQLRQDITNKLFWFLEHESISRCGLPELERFFDYCQNGHKEVGGRWGAALKPNVGTRAYKPLASATLETYHVYIKGFFTFIVKRGALDRSPFSNIERPVNRADQIEPFTLQQVQALCDAARRSSVPARNLAIVLFLLDTGLRVSELCSLKLRDVDFSEERSLKFRLIGKGNVKRTVRLGREASAALWKYFRQEHGIKRRFHKVGRGERQTIDGATPVFMSCHKGHFGDALTRSGVLQMIHLLGEISGIGGVRCSPHTFRHTFAISFLRNGGDIFALKSILGHRNLKTVEIYLKIVRADTDEQHSKFSPADNMF